MDGSIEADDEHHEIHAAVAAFEALSERERANVMRVADFLAGRGTLADANELVNEAYVRVCNGKRRWPRSQSFISFLGGVLKSLATDKMFATDAKKIRSLSRPFAVVTDGEMPNVPDVYDPAERSSKQLQEDLISGLETHFQGDDEMQLFMMGVMDGLRGQALGELVGVDTKRLEALRTRFNRQVDKLAGNIRQREGLPS